MSRAGSVPNDEGVEGPRQLGERFLRELRDLVDQGEISPADARRVIDDLFEAGQADRPRLKWSVWQDHIEEQQLAVISDLRKSS
jgi:polyhydroxyalkanoate synthesis regulator phasin